MSGWMFVGLMVSAGALIALQTPINASLARGIGVLEAALVSFGVGTVVAIAVVALFGTGDLRGVLRAPPWQLVGGALGMTFVTLMVIGVGRIGVTAVMVSGLVGQIVTALIIDHYGFFGIASRPVTPVRIAGVLLLGVALALIHRR